MYLFLFIVLFGLDNQKNLSIAAKKAESAVVQVLCLNQEQKAFDGWDQMPPGEWMQGKGSGVIISEHGFIVTNYHVISSGNEIRIVLNNKKTYTAKLLAFDKEKDIAIVTINTLSPLPYLSLANKKELSIGDPVLAAGYPFNLGFTVTGGIISKLTATYIQTDAVINQGSSGGALVNVSGELIGINTSILSNSSTYIGYSFAVPVDYIMELIKRNSLKEFFKAIIKPINH